jgi:hypothetical protein
LQIYAFLSPISQRNFGLSCKHAARLAMQSGVKPYTMWEEAFVFFFGLGRWMNWSRDGKMSITLDFCERCWIYHRRGGSGCDGCRGKKKL